MEVPEVRREAHAVGLLQFFEWNGLHYSVDHARCRRLEVLSVLLRRRCRVAQALLHTRLEVLNLDVRHSAGVLDKNTPAVFGGDCHVCIAGCPGLEHRDGLVRTERRRGEPQQRASNPRPNTAVSRLEFHMHGITLTQVLNSALTRALQPDARTVPS